MSTVSGACFVALAPLNSETKSVIFGRNSIEPKGEVQEVLYYPAGEESESIQVEGGAVIERTPKFAVILQKSAGTTWGGEYGANNKHVCIGVAWSQNESTEVSIKSTDLVRLALEVSPNAVEAVNYIGSLISVHGNDNSKISIVICDVDEVWLISIGGKLWAAEQIQNGFKGVPSDGLSVTTTISKSSEDLKEKIKALGLWDGSGELNFANSFSSMTSEHTWSGAEPAGDGTFILTSMFETLRAAATDDTRSSSVSNLSKTEIPCHWFTVTPNPVESVFKPFVFAPNPKISPLTKIPENETVTLLHKLHNQRDWETVGDLLIFLESSCVEDINKYLTENKTPNQELDELMKDCVEAEVKFYR